MGAGTYTSTYNPYDKNYYQSSAPVVPTPYIPPSTSNTVAPPSSSGVTLNNAFLCPSSVKTLECATMEDNSDLNKVIHSADGVLQASREIIL
ncbi:hypothetical protein AV274_5637 [Blastocystis sp. ATCC 50177/Nand II]|uniref:Uncharacterized protein n=1 Tax=Blastocystis sp. subtype 1 (strain ATCC 50177 / NandII) TaxID=478820 RepID=A0A196S8F7_BLAHN|nr:hypothetical protein AV274_5637 [Blastocystis sp. ATCC 50177/Nand II]